LPEAEKRYFETNLFDKSLLETQTPEPTPGETANTQL
jgi:hypothetical protein